MIGTSGQETFITVNNAGPAGEQVVVNDDLGSAYSFPAIPLQGGNGGNSDYLPRFDTPPGPTH